MLLFPDTYWQIHEHFQLSFYSNKHISVVDSKNNSDTHTVFNLDTSFTNDAKVSLKLWPTNK